MHLSRYAKEVQIVVRRETVRDTMSQYLIDQIEKTPKIRLGPRTEIERVEGEGHVERVALKSLPDGACAVEEADALFVFIGTRPRSEWLPPDVRAGAMNRVASAVGEGSMVVWLVHEYLALI